MTRPTNLPKWAMNENYLEDVINKDKDGNVILDVNGNPIITQVPNKREISNIKKEYGKLANDPELGRQEFNQILYEICEWIEYLDSK